MMAKKSKSKSKKPKVVKADNSASQHVDTLQSASESMVQAMTELENSDEVQMLVKRLEKAYENAQEIKDDLVERKKKEGVKSLHRYYGEYDIPIPGTVSDYRPADSARGQGKIFIRVYSDIDRPKSHPYGKGGAQLMVSRGESIPQTKGDRAYQTVITPGDFIRLMQYGFDDKVSQKLWIALSAIKVFNDKKRVAEPETPESDLELDEISL